LSVIGVFALAACTATVNAGPGGDAGVDGAVTTSTPDAGDGGNSASVGEPITEAKPNAWTWIPFADSICGDGSPTGIGVNLGTSKRLVVYLEGGGACWDKTTCFDLVPLSVQTLKFDETIFNTVRASRTGDSLDRTLANNPYKDANFVYIPYCTGDIHGGSKDQDYPGGTMTIHHHGRDNIAAFLKRIAPTFKDADRVVLTGSSAGGFGAAVNYWRFKNAFGSSMRIDLVDDSGQPFPVDQIKTYPAWTASWDLGAAFDPGCDGCGADPSKLFPYYLKTYPDARFALLSYDQDGTISTFFGLDGPTFASTLATVTSTQFDGQPNARVFEVSGTKHTMLINSSTGGNLQTTSGTMVLADFLNAMNSDSATWASQKPVAQ
jgi:hypothetical protein